MKMTASDYRRQPDGLRIYNGNVFDAALNRIRYLYDEFENVVCCVSGGKDSTVCFNLQLQVAREKGRLPMRVMWLDQEAEWQATVDEVRKMMYHPDVEPLWFQVPMRLFNATSATEHWLNCWDPAREADWVHPQDPISIKVNNSGTDRFAQLFHRLMQARYPDMPTALVGGVRTEESPARLLGLTVAPIYKWVTWGNAKGGKTGHYTFYPIYDWSYSDVWKAIHDNGWHFNRIYNAMYSYGVPVQGMRVSNVHHETAVHALFYMQEVEPETYERLVHRIEGIESAGKLGKDDFFVSELPFMFKNWREYRDYLLEHLIKEPDWTRKFQARFAYHDRIFGDDLGDEKYAVEIQSILTNDWEAIKMKNWAGTNGYVSRARRERAKEADA